MIDSDSTRRIDACADRNEIDFFELIGFAGRGMRRSDQVNQRIARAKRACDRFIIERVTDHRRGVRRHTRNGFVACEHAHTMMARDQ